MLKDFHFFAVSVDDSSCVILILRLKLLCALFMVVGKEDEGLHEGNEPRVCRTFG